MHPSWRIGSIGQDDGVFVARLADAMHEVSSNDYICERRIIWLLSGVKFERGSSLPPNPVRIAVSEVGDDVVRDDGATVKVVRIGSGTGHEADGPEAVARELISGDENIP